MDAKGTVTPPSDVGLCSSCRHARRQDTRRGAVFYRCARAEVDARFPRYPPTPVTDCPGFDDAESN